MNNNQYSIHTNPNFIPSAYSNWYPPIMVTEKNPEYAQILMPDLASSASEMTTVHQYLYQSWTIDSKEYKTIQQVIKRITTVEQRHFTIIGQLITLLGGQPQCRSSKTDSYWCGDMVDYTSDIHALLSKNAQSEQFAAQAYSEQSEKIKDPYVSKMLARLSLDEELHYRIFSDFLSQV